VPDFVERSFAPLSFAICAACCEEELLRCPTVGFGILCSLRFLLFKKEPLQVPGSYPPVQRVTEDVPGKGRIEHEETERNLHCAGFSDLAERSSAQLFFAIFAFCEEQLLHCPDVGLGILCSLRFLLFKKDLPQTPGSSPSLLFKGNRGCAQKRPDRTGGNRENRETPSLCPSSVTGVGK
jgi:hypothetical protein